MFFPLHLILSKNNNQKRLYSVTAFYHRETFILTSCHAWSNNGKRKIFYKLDHKH